VFVTGTIIIRPSLLGAALPSGSTKPVWSKNSSTLPASIKRKFFNADDIDRRNSPFPIIMIRNQDYAKYQFGTYGNEVESVAV